MDWDKWRRRRKQICLTVDADLIEWARTRYNCSAVFERSLRTLRGEHPRDAILERMESLKVELASLEAQLADLDTRVSKEEEVAATERAREDALAVLARSFWSGETRESLPPRANLVWAESRAQKMPALAGLQPGEVLSLVLARRPARGNA